VPRASATLRHERLFACSGCTHRHVLHRHRRILHRLYVLLRCQTFATNTCRPVSDRVANTRQHDDTTPRLGSDNNQRQCAHTLEYNDSVVLEARGAVSSRFASNFELTSECVLLSRPTTVIHQQHPVRMDKIDLSFVGQRDTAAAKVDLSLLKEPAFVLPPINVSILLVCKT
jgi:hypothetical protein